MSINEIVLAIILACIGSSGLSTLIQFLISRKDKASDKRDVIVKDLEEIKSMCQTHEKDISRTQLLLLIVNYPEDKVEIMKLAEHYFKDLRANWYLSSIFNTWLQENDLAKPDWFNVE